MLFRFTLCCLHCNISSLHVQMFNQMNGKTEIPWRKMPLLQNCSFKWFMSTVFCTKSKECWNYLKKGKSPSQGKVHTLNVIFALFDRQSNHFMLYFYIPIVKMLYLASFTLELEFSLTHFDGCICWQYSESINQMPKWSFSYRILYLDSGNLYPLICSPAWKKVSL